MFIAVEKYYLSCLYPSLNKYDLRCFLNDEIVEKHLISTGKQFHSLGAAVTKARSPADFESCVWRTVSSQSSHHPQEVLLAQFSLYVHKGGLKPDSFHFISFACSGTWLLEHNCTARRP